MSAPTLHENNPFSDSRPVTPRLKQLGFVGIGAMGYFMARNLATGQPPHHAGTPPLLIWNRTQSKAEQLQKDLGQNKIRIARDLAQIATECDVVLTNLANDEVVKSVYEEFSKILQKCPPDNQKIFVETSTIYPTLAGELDRLMSSIPHCHLITSPVFGAPANADKAQLIICMSGDYRSKKEAAFLLVPAIGRKVIDVGGNLEKAPTLKLAGNSVILGMLEVLAESFTLAEKAGIDANDFQNVIKEFLPAPPIVTYGEKMTNDLFDGAKGFAIDGGLKDASHIRRLASEHASPMPIIDIAHQHLVTTRALHDARRLRGEEFEVLDWSAIIAASRVAAGLEGFNSGKHGGVIPED